VATGVEFAVEGRTFTVEAVKEVILSVGTVQTPQILELSGEYFLSFLCRICSHLVCLFLRLFFPKGIGKKELLNRLNIKNANRFARCRKESTCSYRINNRHRSGAEPVVCFQDHTFIHMQFLLKPGTVTFGK